MDTLEQEIGAMRARVESLHLDMVAFRDDLKLLSEQVSMGRGALRVIGVTGAVLVALTTFAAWIGQTLKPFSN